MEENRENLDRVHVKERAANVEENATGLANIPTATPALVAAPFAPVLAALVAGLVPAIVAPAAQPAQGALVFVPPPLAARALSAPVRLPPIAQALTALPDPPYNIVLPPIIAGQMVTTHWQNPGMKLDFIVL